MNNTKNIIGLIIVIIVIVGIAFFATKKPAVAPDTTTNTSSSSETADDTAPSPATPSEPTDQGTAVKAYTLAEVAQHPNAASCWTAVGGKVYDVTAWISKHPGGEGAILSICGKDGTSAFTGQHGGDMKPETMLATFMIGTLKK